MTLTIELPTDELPTDMEVRLKQEAARNGFEPEDYARELIARGLPAPLGGEQQKRIALLQSWIDEDATDDPDEMAAREADWEEFARSINANHSSYRVIYP